VSASNVKNTVLVFGCFRLDVNERLLDAKGKPVPLTPKVFDLLLLLAQNPGKLLGKDWLIDALWPGTFVEEANLTVNISTLRRALESAGGSHYIETVPKRGYRFTAEVLEISPPFEVDLSNVSIPAEPASLESQRLVGKTRSLARMCLAGTAIALIVAALSYFWVVRWNRRNEGIVWVRSIAVLPFRPLIPSSDKPSENTYLGPGMSDAIIRKLSAIRRVTVRATSAVQKYQGTNIDAIAAGRELQVDVVLDGTIQHADNAIRVSVQLLRVSDGSPVWADHYDDYYTNIFQMQDRPPVLKPIKRTYRETTV
jgi:DNA-binding winged helix-turn-helix (wHTH) protein/TolB-like protein